VVTNSTPNPAASSIVVVVLSFRHFLKNTLQGFVTLSLSPPGITIHDCAYHVREDGRAWIGWPSRAYQKSGKQEWTRIVEASDKPSHYRLQTLCVRAVQQFLDHPEKHGSDVATTPIPQPLPPSQPTKPPKANIPW
jgi:hypothetical protein